MKRLGAFGIFLAFTQSGCIAVGYTSSGGWFIWPGGLALVILVLFLLMRRR